MDKINLNRIIAPFAPVNPKKEGMTFKGSLQGPNKDVFERSKDKIAHTKEIDEDCIKAPVKKLYPNSIYSQNGQIHQFGFDACEESAILRAEMRERILSGANLADDAKQVIVMDTPDKGTSQLVSKSKYLDLGLARFNEKKDKYFYICDNLKDMPDLNGVRGKTPLYGKSIDGLRFRLGKIKEAGIKTIIDLRSEGECSKKAKQALSELSLGYLNFPVEDSNWTKESVEKIASYIKAVNAGDFYVGCANGQARTDLAISINYVFNPKAKAVPKLYFGTASSSRVSIKQNISQILDLVKKNKEIVKEWGYENYDEFLNLSTKKLQRLLSAIKFV